MIPFIIQRLFSIPLPKPKGKPVIDDATKETIDNALKPLAALAQPRHIDNASSPDDVEQIIAVCPHRVWQRGLLPGGKYIKSCKQCGIMEEISFATWSTISDR